MLCYYVAGKDNIETQLLPTICHHLWLIFIKYNILKLRLYIMLILK